MSWREKLNEKVKAVCSWMKKKVTDVKDFLYGFYLGMKKLYNENIMAFGATMALIGNICVAGINLARSVVINMRDAKLMQYRRRHVYDYGTRSYIRLRKPLSGYQMLRVEQCMKDGMTRMEALHSLGAI